MKKSLALALLAIFAGFFIYGMYRTNEIKKTIVRAEKEQIKRNGDDYRKRYNKIFGWLQ